MLSSIARVAISVLFNGADGAARLPKARAHKENMCLKSMLRLNVLTKQAVYEANKEEDSRERW
jgi:hypothetical protein